MSHIAPVSFKVANTLAGYRIVTFLTSTANAVKYPASLSELPVGITADTVLDTTGAIPVFVSGPAKLTFNDTCVSGSLVASDSSGFGIPYVNNTAGGYVIGTLIGPKVDATGTVGEVIINPMWKIIT